MSFWYGSYFNLSSRVNSHISALENTQYKYKVGKLDKQQVKDLQNFVKENFNIEINEYIAARIIEQGSVEYDYRTYKYDFEELKSHYKNLDKAHLEYHTQLGRDVVEYTKDDVDKNQIKEIQKMFKDLYNENITEGTAASLIKFDRIGHETGFNFEKFKQHCLNGKLFEYGRVKDFKDYLDSRIIWQGVVDNDSIETLEEIAQTTEQEYGRYNFDICKSQIADLARQSDKMRQQADKELQVTKSDGIIVIKNKASGKQRVIDLNKITSNLDENHKQMILDAITGFNKLSLWEFAIEITNKIGTDLHDVKHSLAEYSIENDIININGNTKEKTDSYTLLHEMMHAMMATVINGKNTTNEPMFKEFADTFNEEQDAYKEKDLRRGSADGSNYTYCAQNILEFAAEAGCLWISGKSNSEFTIATHFPKSYRLFVQLVEKIRAQETGRSINR